MNAQPGEQRPRFKSLSRKEEIILLLSDDRDFTSTQLYLMPLISQAVNRMSISDRQAQQLRNTLLADVSVAARRFLRSRTRKTTYRFAAYFTWYIQERVNELGNH
jgi:hypothetical protein